MKFMLMLPSMTNCMHIYGSMGLPLQLTDMPEFEFSNTILLKYSSLAYFLGLIFLWCIEGVFMVNCAKKCVNQMETAKDISENVILTVRGPVSTGYLDSLSV